MRQAALLLAKDTEFAKRMVNGGRLSVPSVYRSPLSTPDRDAWSAGPQPGAHMKDAPLLGTHGPSFLTEQFIRAGHDFVVLEAANGTALDVPEDAGSVRIGGDALLADETGLFAQRYDMTPGAAYLLRPDGYVAARFKTPDRASIAAAIARARGRT